MKQMSKAVAVGSVMAGLAGAPGDSARGQGVAPPAVRDGARDFDFFMGSWNIRNRRLRNPLTGSTSWYEFEGTVVARPVWGGAANVDEYEGMAPSGPIHGMTVRLYDPQSHQWRLYWANRTKGFLEPPMAGSFENGRGEFFDQETFEGRAIFVRYVWSDITPTSCRWEQAFSADGGKTWEANWTMELTRVK